MRGDWLHETEPPNGASDGPGARVRRTPGEREDENGTDAPAADKEDRRNPDKRKPRRKK